MNANESPNLSIVPEYVWADDSHDTFACGAGQDECLPVGNEQHTLIHTIGGGVEQYPTFTGGEKFQGNPDVVNIPNVEDPLDLTDFQQSMSVRFVYSDTSEFTIAFGRETNGGLRIQFAGYTNIGVNVEC